MSEPESESAEDLLERLSAGDPSAAHALYSLLYDELHAVAGRELSRFRRGQTLQTTAVVNEAYLRLCAGRPRSYESRFHFLCAAAKAMRAVLIDHARRRSTEKRGGDAPIVRFDVGAKEAVHPTVVEVDLLPLHETLERLAADDPELARVVDLRVFGGLTNAEIAALKGVTERTVEREFAVARAFLHRELRRDADNP